MISWLVIALVPFDLAIAAYLIGLSRRNPGLPTLRSRAVTQVILLGCAGLGAVFACAYLTGTHLDRTVASAVMIGLVLLPSVPGAYWTVTYLRGGFR